MQTNPCNPSPCGQNSQCREINGQAVCTCLPNYIGSAPYCRPECAIDSDCSLHLKCQNNKCVDPCPGYCGIDALCQTVNHNPQCTCPRGKTGNPQTRCFTIGNQNTHFILASSLNTYHHHVLSHIIEKLPPVIEHSPINPCQPSPCGPNAICQNINEQAKCSCLPDFMGSPPNCRPECTSHSECNDNLACINNKCADPCLNACGSKSLCHVAHHVPICSCPNGMTGDPFSYCYTQQRGNIFTFSNLFLYFSSIDSIDI
jgi:hypothetical protein